MYSSRAKRPAVEAALEKFRENVSTKYAIEFRSSSSDTGSARMRSISSSTIAAARATVSLRDWNPAWNTPS